MDATTKGAVTPMKNQDPSGSWRTFSTMGSFDGAWSIATGNLLPGKGQRLVNCDVIGSG